MVKVKRNVHDELGLDVDVDIDGGCAAARSKRERRAVRRVEERNRTAFGRDFARARHMPRPVACEYILQRWGHLLERVLLERV